MKKPTRTILRAATPHITSLALFLLVCCACSRYGFEDVAETDAGVDAGEDAGVEPPEVVCDWSVSPPPLAEITLLTELNTAGGDTDPFLSTDALTLYFISDGVARVATRADRHSIFDNVQDVDFVVTPGDLVGGFSFTGDELVAVASGSDWPSASGGADLYIATRPSREEDFSTWTAIDVTNTSGNEFDPRITFDGLELYFSSDGHGGQGGLEILRVQRPSRSAEFSDAPELLEELNSPGNDGSPSLTADGRTVLFISNDAGCNLYYATRPSSDGVFSARQPVTAINTAGYEVEPMIALDGCDLVFGRIDPAGGSGSWDLLQAGD